MIPPWVLIDVHLKAHQNVHCGSRPAEPGAPQRTPGLTLFEQMMANGIISGHVFGVTWSSAHGTDDKPSSRPEQSSDFRKQRCRASSIRQCVQLPSIMSSRSHPGTDEYGRHPRQKLSREPRLLKTIFLPSGSRLQINLSPHGIASFSKYCAAIAPFRTPVQGLAFLPGESTGVKSSQLNTRSCCVLALK